MGVTGFKNYLRDNSIPEKEIISIVSAISTISGEMLEEDVIDSTLFSMSIDDFKLARVKISVRKTYVSMSLEMVSLMY